MKKPHLIFALLTLAILIVFTWHIIETMDLSPAHPKLQDLKVNASNKFYYELELEGKTLQFNLVDPEQAPAEILPLVKLGWNIMHQTQQYAKEYVGNALNCGNCHFSCGNTFGGKNGSISLVGATTWYPEYIPKLSQTLDFRPSQSPGVGRSEPAHISNTSESPILPPLSASSTENQSLRHVEYSERFKSTMTLEQRIDNCFMRSMNGKVLPPESKEMKALVAYLGWISHEVASIKKSPWRGLIPLGIDHTPDLANGKKVYQETCGPCHQPNGQGLLKEDSTLQIPPVWGPDSYNDGAGMNTLPKISSFVYYNMPFQQPSLTKEEAIDVSAYLIKQPRPHLSAH